MAKTVNFSVSQFLRLYLRRTIFIRPSEGSLSIIRIYQFTKQAKQSTDSQCGPKPGIDARPGLTVVTLGSSLPSCTASPRRQIVKIIFFNSLLIFRASIIHVFLFGSQILAFLFTFFPQPLFESEPVSSIVYCDLVHQCLPDKQAHSSCETRSHYAD